MVHDAESNVRLRIAENTAHYFEEICISREIRWEEKRGFQAADWKACFSYLKYEFLCVDLESDKEIKVSVMNNFNESSNCAYT